MRKSHEKLWGEKVIERCSILTRKEIRMMKGIH